MAYLGNYTEDASLSFKFHTTDATGAPITMTSGAVSVYKESDLTQSTAGVTLTANYDSQTGMHDVTIDLSADAFYAVNKDYSVVLTAGVVDGVTVAPAVLAHFAIEKRFQEVDVVKIGGDTQSATDLKDFADAGYDPSTNKVQGVVLVDTVTLLSTDAVSGNAMSTDAADKVADHVWDEPASAHTTLNSFGALLALIKSAGDALALIFTGMTNLAQWLGAGFGKQTPNSTALTEINATGAGSGTYSATTDSQEALRDRGDAAWTTATGFSTLDAAGVRTAVGLASANLDTQLGDLPTANENADALLDRANGVETGLTPRQLQRIIFAALAGESSGHSAAGATAAVFKNLAEDKNRITVDYDSDGNRTSITLDLT